MQGQKRIDLKQKNIAIQYNKLYMIDKLKWKFVGTGGGGQVW